MYNDSIVEEVRKAAEEIAKECDYDLHKFAERLKKNTELSRQQGFKVVSKDEVLKNKKIAATG